ncbi:MAG: biopolymer transporter ExbD [Porticoccus sp.]|uniref:ExbD/TolR family protein n=1 Tax=Porticoccus hydrocarbonoclasticus TaxID=1073414 RepID=UPI000561A68D|nr:biopolymer transporter ExbD [Porticoccus hydrocarbonoclasticus]MBG56745.1 biopolymer transporter ExbD [Porticoccus sp.]
MIRSPLQIKLEAGLELTPLIDIIFIVVVFLLLTANHRLLSLPVDIPDTDQATSELEEGPQRLLITLYQDSPHWGIGEQRYNHWQEFQSRLLPQLDDKNRPVTVAPDSRASVESLVKLLALLNERQMTDTQILMESKP